MVGSVIIKRPNLKKIYDVNSRINVQVLKFAGVHQHPIKNDKYSLKNNNNNKNVSS